MTCTTVRSTWLRRGLWLLRLRLGQVRRRRRDLLHPGGMLAALRVWIGLDNCAFLVCIFFLVVRDSQHRGLSTTMARNDSQGSILDPLAHVDSVLYPCRAGLTEDSDDEAQLLMNEAAAGGSSEEEDNADQDSNGASAKDSFHTGKASVLVPQADLNPLLVFLQRKTTTGTTTRMRTNLTRTTTGKSFEIGRRTGARTSLTRASREAACSMIATATIEKLRSFVPLSFPLPISHVEVLSLLKLLPRLRSCTSSSCACTAPGGSCTKLAMHVPSRKHPC